MDPQESPLDIDRDHLDREWLRQPGRARAAGVREADAKLEHSRAASALKVTDARLYLMFRTNPGFHGLRDKATVDEIAAAVEVHKDHVEAVERLNTAKYALDIATAEVTAYIDRRKALERLVDLLSMDYFSAQEPRTKSGRRPDPDNDRDPGVDFTPRRT